MIAIRKLIAYSSNFNSPPLGELEGAFKKFITITISLLFLLATAAMAQCPMRNEAFGDNEKLEYNLYFNWKFIWVNVGTATMQTKATTYRSKPAYYSYLTTNTSSRADKFFRMRDTLSIYATRDLIPLYYKKVAREGKRYYVDEIAYSYPNGKCGINVRNRHNDGSVTKRQFTYDHCVYDMLSIFLCARNYNPAGWKKGHTVNIDIAGGSELTKAKLVYRGTETVKADNKKKYSCLVLSYIEKDDGKDKEIVRFFVTNDKAHIPVRLDLFLKFGSAKAFLK